MAVSCFVMGQKLTQFGSSDVDVEVDVQVFYVYIENNFSHCLSCIDFFLISTFNIICIILHYSIIPLCM